MAVPQFDPKNPLPQAYQLDFRGLDKRIEALESLGRVAGTVGSGGSSVAPPPTQYRNSAPGPTVRKAVRNEDLICTTVNGATRYSFRREPIPDTVVLYMGVSASALYRVAPSGFAISNKTITFKTPPADGTVFLVDYEYLDY
jgi:hypothetical protein